jgi:hypothetical protein
MKKQLLYSLMISGFLLSSVAAAANEHERDIKPPDQALSAWVTVPVGVVSSLAVHMRGEESLGADRTIQIIFHGVNLLYQAGQSSLAWQTFLAGSAATAVTIGMAKAGLTPEAKAVGVLTLPMWYGINSACDAAKDLAGYGSK